MTADFNKKKTGQKFIYELIVYTPDGGLLYIIIFISI